MTVTIISVGNGGFNVATDIINAGIFPEHKFIVVDTDEDLLSKNAEKADKSILFGKFGRGKVKSNLIGMVDDVLDGTSDTVIVCATLGGMTGSKYAPLISLNAIVKGKFVCNVTTSPMSYEGEIKNNRALNAWQQMICSANLSFQQNNDQLDKIDNLMLGDMNKPMVDTIANACSDHSLEELSKMSKTQLGSSVPKDYQLEGIQLVKIIGDCYPQITDPDRKELFDELS